MAFWSKWFGGMRQPVRAENFSKSSASEEDHFVLRIRDLPEKSIDNLPESRWPPFPRAVKAIGVRDIINSQAELIRSLCRVCPLSEEQINDHLLPSIVNLAEFVHLLPASQYDHHMGTGGLFGHSLETAYYCVNGGKSRIFDVTESPERAHLNRGRWVLASALTGLLHDAGKAVTDMIVTSDRDQDVWYPRRETLAAWLRRKGLESYYVSWKQNREHNRHQTASVDYAHVIIPRSTFQFLSSAGNFRIEEEIRDAVLSSVSSRRHPLAELLATADKLSCRIDKDRRKGIDPKDFYVSSPIAESVVDALRDLVKTGKWKVNEPNGRVFITNAGTFVVWTDLDDLIQYLCSKEIRAVPREPNVLADILIDHGVGVAPPAELTTAEGRYWSVCPICSPDGFLTTLRIDDPKRLYASGIAPMPIVAMIRGMELSEEDREAWIAQHGAVPQSKNVAELAEDEAWINSLLEDAEKYAEESDDATETSWLDLLPSERPEEEVPAYLLNVRNEEEDAAERPDAAKAGRPDETENGRPSASVFAPNKPAPTFALSEENREREAKPAEELLRMLSPSSGFKGRKNTGKKNPERRDSRQSADPAEMQSSSLSSPEKENEPRGSTAAATIREEPAEEEAPSAVSKKMEADFVEEDGAAGLTAKSPEDAQSSMFAPDPVFDADTAVYEENKDESVPSEENVVSPEPEKDVGKGASVVRTEPESVASPSKENTKDPNVRKNRQVPQAEASPSALPTTETSAPQTDGPRTRTTEPTGSDLLSFSEKGEKAAEARQRKETGKDIPTDVAGPFDAGRLLPTRPPKKSRADGSAASAKTSRTRTGRKTSSGGGVKGAPKPNPETVLRDMFARMKEQFAQGEGPWLEDVRPDRYGVRCDGSRFLAEAEKAGVVAPELLLLSIVSRVQKAPVLAWDASEKEFVYKNRP